MLKNVLQTILFYLLKFYLSNFLMFLRLQRRVNSAGNCEYMPCFKAWEGGNWNIGLAGVRFRIQS